MKENKKDTLDNLFKSNSDYLGKEPHPDFNPEAFWKELRPELTQEKTRKVAWWWQAAAAAVVLFLGGIGWTQLTSPEVPQTAVNQSTTGPVVAGAKPGKKANPIQPTSMELPENIATSQRNVAKVSPRPQTAPVVKNVEESTAIQIELPAGKETDRTVQVPQVVGTSTLIQEFTSEAIEKPTKPKYRIVHLNELRKPKVKESHGRSRVAFRIGAAAEASAPVVTTPTPRIIISIQPQ
jgi:hypothetical protein